MEVWCFHLLYRAWMCYRGLLGSLRNLMLALLLLLLLVKNKKERRRRDLKLMVVMMLLLIFRIPREQQSLMYSGPGTRHSSPIRRESGRVSMRCWPCVWRKHRAS